MLLPIYVALVVAFVFYLVLPVIGAYLSRDMWRRFRERLIQLSLAPRLSLGRWAFGDAGKAAVLPGRYRFYGSIEAIEGEDRIWVRGDGMTATVDLGRSAFHILADEGGEADSSGRHTLVERLPWSRVRVFPEVAKVFVGGAVRVEGGKPLFVEEEGEPLVVVSYEGPESSLLSRLIAGGRRGNEYWNPLSRVSMTLGMGGMGIFLAIAWGAEYFPSVIFISFLIALAPALVLLPPGLPFFFLYLRFWKRGLESRTLRDLLRLPLRFFDKDRPGQHGLESGPAMAALPEGGSYEMATVEGEPGDEFDLIVPEGRSGKGGSVPRSWVRFEPKGSDDPAARRIAIAGDPEALARRADRAAMMATAASGASLAFGILLNLVTAIVLWRGV